MKTVLFRSPSGDVSAPNLVENLRSIGAADCDVLYIHTDMTFGLPALKRGHLLEEMVGVLDSLKVGTLVFPTFTFSFCNNEPFDVQKSHTAMGAINEYVRKSGRGTRSADPLLSVYVLGDKLNLVDNLSEYSIGAGSNYDRLHTCGKEVKFLFLGADMRDCFTYTHYMEAVVGVPYRYNREFTGTIVDNGQEKLARAFLYSSYANCRLNPVPVVHDTMQKRGQLRKAVVGTGNICCFSEKDAFVSISDLLSENPLFLTDGTFNDAIKDTSYNPNSDHIVSVR